MKKSLYISYFIFLLIILVGCKSVRTITSKDNSTNINHRQKNKRKVEFIEGIEITPGSVVKSKHKPATTKTKTEIAATTESIPKIKSIDLTKASKQQLKYAIILDTYIENITNVSLYNKIDEWWGVSYCFGGNSKECIDCSSFTGTVARDVYKINLPRTASEQFVATDRIDKENLKEGDLVFFKTKRGYVSHVGMYLHNNKFVHASTSNGVMISDLNETYWKGKYAGGGRIIN